MKTEKEVWSLLNDFEQEKNIFAIRVCGVSVWQLTRFNVASRLQQLPLRKKKNPKSSFRQALTKGLKFWKLLPLKNIRYLALTFYSGSRLETNGKYEDVWFDQILKDVQNGTKFVQMNVAGYESRIQMANIQPDYDMTLLIFMSSVLARLFPIRSGRSQFRQTAALCNYHFTELNLTPQLIEKKFSQVIWLARIYRLLLKWMKPKACIVADTGEFSLLLACKREKVKFIEIQHGIYTKFHPHVLSDAVADQHEILLFPSAIAVYGEFWKNELQGTAQDALNLIKPVGNGILERYRSKRTIRSQLNELRLLLTTQGLDTENLIKFVLEFLKISPSNFILKLKLHPAYEPDKSIYAALKYADPRVVIVGGKEEPNTYELLSWSDLHLSIASACHYDALSMAVPTCVLGLQGYELMKPLYERHQASLAMNPSELAEIVHKLSKGSFPAPDYEKFCRRDFSKNIAELLP